MRYLTTKLAEVSRYIKWLVEAPYIERPGFA